MNVTLVGDNGLSILADATVAQAESAFKTRIQEFAPMVGYAPPVGHLFSFTSAPALPADIQPNVVDISGLESFSHAVPANDVTPNQVQTLYDLTPLESTGVNGQGRTIAISSWDGYRLSNVPHEYSQFSLPAPSGGVGSNITVKTIDGGSGAGTEQGEADLDIQSILGVAPLCNLIIYDGAGGDLINVLTQEVNDNKADIISESYGWEVTGSTATAAHNLHLSMEAQGITYMAASGDHGTTISYYYPDIDPEVLLVGGTTVSVSSNGARESEVGWTGSGGGWVPTSDAFNKLPSWQAGTGVPTATNYRLIPDVALNADPDSGYVVYLDGGFQVIGGTSGASPTFAGSLGVAEQELIANSAIQANSDGKYRLGRLQDVVYSLGGNSSVFYDVTSGSNGKLPGGATSEAGVGWDTVTGWGAMDFNGFVTALSGSGLTSFSVSPTSVEGGVTKAIGTVSTVTVAPTGGTVITLTGGDSSVTYPSSVTITAGTRTASFTITSTAVSSVHTEALTATLGQQTKSATLTVNPTTISTFTVSPTSLVGAGTSTGTVTLLHAAPSGGDTIALSGGDSSISYPSSVTVSGGATSATFTITASGVSTTDSEVLTATLGSSTKTATLSLTALKVTALTFSPASLIGGASATGTVSLSAAVSAATTVTLSGGDSSIGLPTSVTVAAKASSATFAVTTKPVTSADAESITATLNSTGKSATLTVNPITVTSLTLAPTAVIGGASATGTVTLSAAVASATTVTLSGGDSSITLPSTVTVAAKASSATFKVTTSAVSSVDAESISASLNSSSKTSTLTVNPVNVSSLTFAPASVTGGVSATGTVTINSAAPSGGLKVTLAGGDSSVTVPSSVTVKAGATTATFTVTTSAVSANDSEAITATVATTVKATLSVLAPSIKSITFSPATVTGGSSCTGTVTLTGAAATGGITVTLSGGNSSISYPSSVKVAAGSSSATFTVTSSSVSAKATETIAGKIGSSAASTASLVVNTASLSSISGASTSVAGGSTLTVTLTLNGPAPSVGAAVTLSGATTTATYPAKVTVPAGATSVTFTVTGKAVTKNTPLAISASCGGVTKTLTLSIAP